VACPVDQPAARYTNNIIHDRIRMQGIYKW
jgi:hypothetical protein